MRAVERRSWLVVAVLLALVSPAAWAQSEPAAVQAANSVRPAVVMVESDQGWGTGFFISREGYLLTNNHVVQDTQRVTVIYRNAERLEASVVATDAFNDVAVLKATAARDFPTVRLGDSDEVQEGTPVAVTGYPQPSFTTHVLGSGVQSCTTLGVVAARRAGGMHGAGSGRAFLQYDATTLRGNSGGPVYRTDTGEVVAVVCLGGNEGGSFNFGVPINEAKLLLQKAGVAPQPNVLAPTAAETQVAPGDVSLLSTVGADKSLNSLLATHIPLAYRITDEEDRYEQLLTNAGYLSCYGRLAPDISPPVLSKGRLIMTQGTGQVVAYDPRGTGADTQTRSLFDVESGYLFYPAAADDKQIVFASGTPTFAAKEKVDTGLAILSFLAAAAGSPGGPVTKIIPTLDAQGSIFSINPNSGSPYWEYKAGYVSTPVLAGDRVYFGGMGIYGALETNTGREVWVKKERLGGTGARWYNVAQDDQALYVLVSPVKSEFSPSFPGFRIRGDGPLALMAVSLTDGKQVWRKDVCNLRGQDNPLATGLAVDRAAGRIYLTRNERVWAFDRQGKQVWAFGEKPKQERRRSKEEEKEVVSTLKRLSPSIAFDDRALYLGGDDGRVYSLDAATGTQRWAFTGLRTMGEPTLAGGSLFCGSKDGWMYALNPANGELRWKAQVRYSAVGRPLLYQDVLYFSAQGGEGFASTLQMVYVPPAQRVAP